MTKQPDSWWVQAIFFIGKLCLFPLALLISILLAFIAGGCVYFLLSFWPPLGLIAGVWAGIVVLCNTLEGYWDDAEPDIYSDY